MYQRDREPAAKPPSTPRLPAPESVSGEHAEVLALQAAIGNAATAAVTEHDEEPDPERTERIGVGVRRVLSAPGTPLEPDVRAEMEARLGADFSDVRLHRGGAAHQSATALGAEAYTSGSNIVFRAGAYDPRSIAGRRTLAHELTHVTQQRSGPVDGAPAAGGVRVSGPDDPFERAATANAERVTAGPAPAGPVDAQRSAAAPHGQAPVQRVLSADERASRRAALLAEVNGRRSSMPSDGREAVGGPDLFGVRQAPAVAPPEAAQGVDTSAPENLAAYFQALNLAGDASTASSEEGAVTTGEHGAAAHLVHSIWFGGPLYDDSGGARRTFMTNIAAMARQNPSFTFVVWTDLTRAAATAEEPDPRVAEMTSWASAAKNIVISNIDEVFSAEPMSLDAEVRTERGRRNPAGYAAASDMARVEILHRFGGIYTDGDNPIKPDLESDGFAGALGRVTNDPGGFGVQEDRLGLRTNAVMAAVPGSAGTAAYREALRANYGMSVNDMYLPPWSNAPEAPGSASLLRRETVRRTGPYRDTWSEIAKRSGLDSPLRLGPEAYLRIESGKSWIPGAAGTSSAGPSAAPPALPQYDLPNFATAVTGAVASLLREREVREEILYLPAADRTISRLPDADDREVAWLVTLDVVHQHLTAAGQDLVVYSDHNVTLPDSVRNALASHFPRAVNATTENHVGPTEAVGSILFGYGRKTIWLPGDANIDAIAARLRAYGEQVRGFTAASGQWAVTRIVVTGYGNNASETGSDQKRANYVAGKLRDRLRALDGLIDITTVAGGNGNPAWNADARRRADVAVRVEAGDRRQAEIADQTLAGSSA